VRRENAQGARSTTANVAVVERWEDIPAGTDKPLLVLEPLARYLDGLGLGDGPITARAIGDGHSFETFLLIRGKRELVLRRPPRPPFAAGVHDVLREGRVLAGLDGTSVRAPRLLAVCEDDAIIGVPFIVMERVAGVVIARDEELGPGRAGPAECALLGTELIDALVELHACDFAAQGLATLGRPEGFLRRRMERSQEAWERVAVRSVPAIERVARLLERQLPPEQPPTLVHGDYRLGNVMFAPDTPTRLAAILDWETTTVGDPLTDLGYTIATTPTADEPAGILLSLQSVALRPGFPSREALAQRYAERSGRSLECLGWYMAYSLWRVAIQLEGLYARAVEGSSTDPWHREFEHGVPELAERALRIAETL
jgi:aminoglycoside phosphotransferase (APT) family kinase protein